MKKIDWGFGTSWVSLDGGATYVPLGEVRDVKIELPATMDYQEAMVAQRQWIEGEGLMTRDANSSGVLTKVSFEPFPSGEEDSFNGFPYLPSGSLMPPDPFATNEISIQRQARPKPPVPIISMGKSKRRIVFED